MSKRIAFKQTNTQTDRQTDRHTHSISGRVSIVRFGDGASAFCWLEQR